MAISPDRKAASAARRRANRAKGGPPGSRIRARPIIPGTRYLVTRRCVERRWFLTPDKEHAERINNFIGYALAVCVERYGMDLHAFVALSSHVHECLTDRFGNLPAFKTTLHGWIARGINALRGRSDKFWSADQAVDVRPGDPIVDDDECVEPRSALDELVYTLTNPVKDGATRNGGRWPGFTTYGMRFGETRTFKRPDWFFDPNNPDLPDEATLTLARPKDVLPELRDDEVFEELRNQVRERELQIRAEMKKQNRRFMGETKIRKQRWTRTSMSYEDRFSQKKRVRDRSPRRRAAALARDRDWRLRYAEARRHFLAGARDVVFPHGTYWMVRFAGAEVATGPP